MEVERGENPTDELFVLPVKPAEKLLDSYFELVETGEKGAHLLSTEDFYEVLKKNSATLKDCSCTAFVHQLAQMRQRVHTRYGNGY